jgi:hypothetical protein
VSVAVTIVPFRISVLMGDSSLWMRGW